MGGNGSYQCSEMYMGTPSLGNFTGGIKKASFKSMLMEGMYTVRVLHIMQALHFQNQFCLCEAVGDRLNK